MEVGRAYPVRRNDIAPGAVGAVALQAGLIRATPVIDTFGPLTLTGTFTKVQHASTIVMFISGSAYATSGSIMDVFVNVDGVQRASIAGYTNELNSHKALISRLVVFPETVQYSTPLLSKGPHTITMTLNTGATNSDDRFYLVTLEIPTL